MAWETQSEEESPPSFCTLGPHECRPAGPHGLALSPGGQLCLMSWPHELSAGACALPAPWEPSRCMVRGGDGFVLALPTKLPQVLMGPLSN